MTTNSVEKWLNGATQRPRQHGARHGIRLKNPKALEKWIYILAIVLAGVWALVMWGVYALLSFSDETLSAASRFFTIDAQIFEWLAAFVGGTQQLGAAFVLIVWGLGTALLVVAGWLGRRLIRAFGNPSASGETHAI